jgi:hypothetical protein
LRSFPSWCSPYEELDILDRELLERETLSDDEIEEFLDLRPEENEEKQLSN